MKNIINSLIILLTVCAGCSKNLETVKQSGDVKKEAVVAPSYDEIKKLIHQYEKGSITPDRNKKLHQVIVEFENDARTIHDYLEGNLSPDSFDCSLANVRMQKERFAEWNQRLQEFNSEE